MVTAGAIAHGRAALSSSFDDPELWLAALAGELGSDRALIVRSGDTAALVQAVWADAGGWSFGQSVESALGNERLRWLDPDEAAAIAAASVGAPTDWRAARSEWSPFTLAVSPSVGHDLDRFASAADIASTAASSITERVRTAVAEERTRIASAIHAHLAQDVTSLAVRSDVVSSVIRKDPDLAAEMLAEIRSDATGVVRAAREMISDLVPEIPDGATFVEAVTAQAITSSDVGGPQVTVQVNGTPVAPSPGHASIALDFVTEALTNIRNHANSPTRAELHVSFGALLQILVRDDGRPVNGQGGPVLKRGHGLDVLHARARIAGGLLEMRRTEGGTVVELDIPS